VAEASLEVEVSVNSDLVAVSGKDNMTDIVKAKSAKCGRDKVNYCTGAGPGWETHSAMRIWSLEKETRIAV
jgi:hypothetical protein